MLKLEFILYRLTAEAADLIVRWNMLSFVEKSKSVRNVWVTWELILTL